MPMHRAARRGGAGAGHPGGSFLAPLLNATSRPAPQPGGCPVLRATRRPREPRPHEPPPRHSPGRGEGRGGFYPAAGGDGMAKCWEPPLGFRPLHRACGRRSRHRPEHSPLLPGAWGRGRARYLHSPLQPALVNMAPQKGGVRLGSARLGPAHAFWLARRRRLA